MSVQEKVSAAARTDAVSQKIYELELSLKTAPKNAQLHHELGYLYWRMGDAAQAEMYICEACELEPSNTEYLDNIRKLYDQQKTQDKALDYFARFVSLGVFHLAHYYRYAALLERANRIAESREVVNQLLEHAPEALMTMQIHLKLLSREKQYVQARDYFEAHQGAMAIKDSLTRSIYFDMIQVYERLEAYDQAMQMAHQANQISMHLAGEGVNKTAIGTLAKAFNALFDAVDIAEATRRTKTKEVVRSPVFIVGFPRSGTTLLHQILIAEPRVKVLEERPCLNNTFRRAMQMKGQNLLQFFTQVSTDELEMLRQYYWEQVGEYESLEGDVVLVDKMPLDTLKLPFIKLLFPNAKILFAQRHPFDAILSCYFQDFELNNAMANFTTLDDSVQLYLKIMAIWQKSQRALELDYHTVCYEKITSDLEAQTKALANYLGIEWSNEFLTFDQRAKERAINTPSYSQVAQPIYQSSKARWKRYAAYFEPYQLQMQPFLNAFGYES